MGTTDAYERVFGTAHWKQMAQHLTQADVAACFSCLPHYQNSVKYCRTSETWFVFVDGIWHMRGKNDDGDLLDGLKELRELVDIYHHEQHLRLEHNTPDLTEKEKKMALKKLRGVYNLYEKLGCMSFCAGVIKLLRAEMKVPNFLDITDQQKNLVAFTDCALDLDTGKVVPLTKDLYIRTTTGYPYPSQEDKETEDKLWEIFHSMFEDKRDALYMITTIAYCLHGDKNNLDLFFSWVGKGGNGKGCMLILIKNAFGGYFSMLPVSYLTQRRTSSSSAQPELANKVAARIVVSTEPETEQGEVIRMDKIKEFSDEIECRQLYKNPFTFKPQFALFIQSNQDPVFSSSGDAVTRRYRGLRFPVQFKSTPDPANPQERQSDPKLKQLLSSERYRNAFMRILLKTYADHVKDKGDLESPPNVQRYVQTVLDDNDEYGQFVKQYIIETNDPNDKVESRKLYDEFCDFVGRRVDAGQFGKKMKNEQGLERNKRNFIGIKLVTDDEQHSRGGVP